MYETISEYLRDLVRKDMLRQESTQWGGLRSELEAGALAPKSEFIRIQASDVITRNKP